MFYVIDNEGTVFEGNTLNEAMFAAEGCAYGDISEWDIFEGKKIEVERIYQVKATPKPAAKKPAAKPAVKK